ncbi:histidine ammonia-lyase [Ectobacillus ponti]|uniref:Histidine ammonia-lyase n=1 Tax=Ectobacillus ponti TaxID=2961894 RepID=A0AA41X5L3_9BACI|nr:histidine ammonia-lyase [Ectobacillus ponti]MCP8969112.1 histidine ammonia-lyase [Ectobacillus ponti]
MMLTGETLTISGMRQLLGQEAVTVCPKSMARVQNGRQAVERLVEQGKTVYGITTGFGKFSDVRISKEHVERLQHHLLRSHACGVGEPFSEAVSRAMLILRVNTLLKGVSGVRPALIERLVELVNRRIHPVVPQQGSLGASGDLAPLSHMALPLLGEGEVWYRGSRMPAAAALQQEGLQPLTLEAKEGLALINGTQAMTAMGVVAYIEAEQLADQADWIAAMTLEGLRGIVDAFREEIHVARGYQEQIETAARIRRLLQGSGLVTKQGELRVQDAYSLRCIPQVHGAARQVLGYVKEKLEIEMNAATDNPLLFQDGAVVLSGGNFHGQPIAFAMDFLKLGMAELANISERRIERLVNPQLNDLPPFLSPEPGLQSGAMILQYVAASLVSENKTLAHPASVDSIPSSANQEDHVSMGTIAARHAYSIISNVRRVLAIELICAMQAAEHRGVHRLAPATHAVYEKGRKIVPSITQDRVFSGDIERMAKWLKETHFEEERQNE